MKTANTSGNNSLKGTRITGHLRFFALYSIIALMALLSPVYAAQTTSAITVSVLVQGSFYLMVNTDSFDFARLAPGQTGEMNRSEGVTVTGASSGGNPWYLKVSTIKPLTSGSNFIPNENFTWYGTSEGTGAWYGTGEKSFADPSNTAYVSSGEEADQISKVANKFKFRLHAPEDTKPGAYTTTVMFTMTE
jgi:hypothetical protein